MGVGLGKRRSVRVKIAVKFLSRTCQQKLPKSEFLTSIINKPKRENLKIISALK
jgi:hypothetical protein